MRRRAFRIRRWLLLAVAVSALAISSTAQARFYSGEDQGRVSGGNAVVVSTKSAPVAGPGAGFDWGYALVGVGTVLLVGITGVGLVQLGRNRRRLATLL
jgi:hypothetical protein